MNKMSGISDDPGIFISSGYSIWDQVTGRTVYNTSQFRDPILTALVDWLNAAVMERTLISTELTLEILDAVRQESTTRICITN
jgi:hypothetical protein